MSEPAPAPATYSPPPKEARCLGDTIEVWGECTVTNGKTKFTARNKIIGQGLNHLLNRLLTMSLVHTSQGLGTGGTATIHSTFETNQLARSRILVGTGSGPSTDGTVNLVSPVAVDPTQTIASVENPTNGIYLYKFTAVWEAGRLTHNLLIQEIGIFGWLRLGFNNPIIQNVSGTVSVGGTANSLFARISASDGEFNAFNLDASLPLAIEYKMVLSFT